MSERAQDQAFMQRAIELSRYAAIEQKSGGAFGAVVAKDGQIIAEGYNQVIKRKDPTWHAEIHAIREACQKLNDPHLEGCVLYTSAECCPMCLAAAYWAHITHIYFAANTKDAFIYGDFQDQEIFDEICNSSLAKIKRTELMRQEALIVWREFAAMEDRAKY